MVTVMTCKCNSDYQDKKHGPKRRVHNEGVKVWRCTVCTDEKKKDS